jgi:outer membrane protein assembly factor BamB
MRACVGVLVLMLGVQGARGAAPFVHRPAKAWTGTIDAPRGTIKGVSLSPDGHTLFTTGDLKISVWDLRTGKFVRGRHLENGDPSPTERVFVNSGKQLACTGFGNLYVLDLQTLNFRLAHKRGPPYWIARLASSPDGAFVAGSKERYLAVWDVAKGKLLWHKEVEKAVRLYVRPIAFSPDSKVLAVGVDDGNDDGTDVARLYDVATGRELRRMSSKVRGPQYGLVFSNDGRWLATAFRDESHVEVWDAHTGELRRRVRWTLRDKKSSVWGLCLSPDGKTLFVHADEGMRLYETATWGLRCVIDRRPSDVRPCPGDRLVCLDWRAGRADVIRWREPAKAGERTREEMTRLWDHLRSDDAEVAFRAGAELLACPDQAAAKLSRLESVDPVGPKLIARLIAELDAEDQDVRDRASRELGKAGAAADLPLRAALATDPSLEMKKRISALLKALDKPDPIRVRFLRCVEILEALATPKALKILERLAGGAEGAEATQDAKAALARVRKLAK